ncbi:hypothetical protein [Luteibacter sp.]|uniref:hypothetical protein n=1 Tax=Luteibacter sp. TaxID=1886636 RepID=UPI002806E741|nr:hypothetical protein [Luteibacter sp.]MDQ8051065.1 hypothetical protein [Luteibacter sp.]
MSITLELLRTHTATLRRAFAGEGLIEAMGRGRGIYDGAAFDRMIEQLHSDPLAMAAIWQAWLDQLSMYGAALHEKAEAEIAD